MKLTLLSIAAAIVATVTAAPIAARAADNKVVVGYWVPWGKTATSALDFSKFTHLNYGFAVLTTKTADPATITIDRYYDGTPMRDLVTRGNAAGVPILMSIGGWTGSQTYSTVSADATIRKRFINNAMVFIRNNTLPLYADTPDGWNMDGIDIDWEYPGRAGAICNIVSPNDSANYLTLLKELRAQMDLEFPTTHKLLTAAVRVQPFDGADGKPMSNVAAYAQYYDYVNVMAYDIMGSWSNTTGPNAPFNYPTVGDKYSFTQAVDSWLGAGWPANKLVMGTAFYGRSLTATVDMNALPYSMAAPHTATTPKGGPDDANDINFFCNEGSYYSGMWKWKDIRAGILTSSLTTASNGWVRYWDDATQTPWAFRSSDKTFLSYDDPQSLGLKVAYINQKGLRGAMYWDMTMDYNNEMLSVLNQVHCTSNCPATTISTSMSATTTVASTTTTVASTTTTKASTTTVATTTTAASTTTTKASTTTTAATTTSASGGNCAGIQTWTASGVYVGGTVVQYNGNKYSAKWWTTNEMPGTTGDWGVWSAPTAC